MIEIDGKKYELTEAYTIDENEVNTRWAHEWGGEDTYEVDVAQKAIRVKKCFVLTEIVDE